VSHLLLTPDNLGVTHGYSDQTPRFWHNGTTDFLTIDFYADGSVRFNNQYGPYPAQCYGEKFLTVNTGDSFETFTFEKNIFVIY
jgi:hypothetical protein